MKAFDQKQHAQHCDLVYVISTGISRIDMKKMGMRRPVWRFKGPCHLPLMKALLISRAPSLIPQKATSDLGRNSTSALNVPTQLKAHTLMLHTAEVLTEPGDQDQLRRREVRLLSQAAENYHWRQEAPKELGAASQPAAGSEQEFQALGRRLEP